MGSSLFHCTTRSAENIVCSVPQGSVIRLIILNLCINDNMPISGIFMYVMFADDTNILYSCKRTKNIKNILNTELNKLHNWLCSNKLSIYVSKTNFIIFSESKNEINPNVLIDNHEVEQSDCVKFLSVFIDGRLTLKKHIYICFDQIEKSFIFKSSIVLDIKSLIITISLSYPHTDYCCEVGGNTCKTIIHCICMVQ